MENRIKVHLELKRRIYNDPNFIKLIITSDKICVFGHDRNENSKNYLVQKNIEKCLNREFKQIVQI